MNQRRAWGCLLASLSVPALALAADGKVRLPLETWQEMRDQLEANAKKPVPGVAVCPIERRIDGVFRKGLYSATLVARFEVLDDRGHVRVPVLDARAALGEVLLDGKPTSLLREGDLYTLGVDQPGGHEVRVKFHLGRELERFARQLRFRLPPAGATVVSVLLPETDVEPRLGAGVLEPPRPSAGGTQLVAHLDASGRFDLVWNRRLAHKEQQAVKSEARLNALFTMGESVVDGMAVFDHDILEGETDRIDLALPANIEVSRVDGDAVLQWYTASDQGNRLIVLLRYLVDKKVRFAVHFQYPVEAASAPIDLRLPLPLAGTPVTGNLGVLSPPGLSVELKEAQRVQALTPRDMPPELTDLSSSPLLLGFTFDQEPRVLLAVERMSEVELTTTIIDELQASSVINEDGTEVTKLKLRVRNNARQYAAIDLPPGALLTHSLIDGTPVRPALAQAASGAPPGREHLLLPLRQSQRVGEGRSQQRHVVAGNETLSDIANFYYGDPTAWRRILDNNQDQLGGPEDLLLGQQLRIPAAGGAAVEESSFIIELAYKLQHPALGSFGRRGLVLPGVDIEVVKVVWHVYFPEALEPLSFDANLRQYSAIRYDPFRRVLQFLDHVRWVRHAWAGGYTNILQQRRAIWTFESTRKERGRAVLSSFPLVGERYRFKRLFPGTEQPRIAVSYLDRDAIPPLRWIALGVAFLLATLLLWRRRRGRELWWTAGIGLLVLLVCGHFVLGINRRIVWGVDLALLLAWLRLAGRPLWRAVRDRLSAPWSWGDLLRLRPLVWIALACVALWVTLRHPLLLSTIALVVLLAAWWQAQRAAAGREVRHA
ncbi:MAG: LysM peptidoglycan-binding domain-containing protein [Deltaproteobacteria bacterium]|nr:LysM peptidoglycan-binding domain-containing protein [Deltaproteobacteria bacterium]